MAKGTLTHGVVTVTTTRTEIVPANRARAALTLTNAGVATAYCGGSDLTTSNWATDLAANEEATDRDSGAAWFGITESGTAVVHWQETTGG